MDQNNDTKDVVIERTINAPVAQVWDMWAKSENFKKWYGPTSASIPVADMDVAVGGKRFVCMEVSTPNGPMRMYFSGKYTAVDQPNKLEYTEVMCDEDGTPVPPSAMGMPGDEPEVTTVTVELSADDDNTKLVLTHAGVPAGSPGEMGWNMAIDKLDGMFA